MHSDAREGKGEGLPCDESTGEIATGVCAFGLCMEMFCIV